jgi:hypothetical protein
MSVLMQRESPAQIKEKTIVSPSAWAPLAPRMKVLQQGNPQCLDKDERGRQARGVRLKKFEAEDLLDWLEANGRSGRLSYAPSEGYAVW